MSWTRRAVAAAGLATVATLGLGLPAANAAIEQPTAYDLGQPSAQWYWVEDDGGLVNISDNNVGPFQVCHNDVPVNAVGGQVPVSDVVGILGIDSDGNTATLINTCDQQTEQVNHKATRWYRVGDHGGLVNISDNNVGPFQACHNFVPVNAVGGQVPINDITGILGIGTDGNSATLVETCDQPTVQHNH